MDFCDSSKRPMSQQTKKTDRISNLPNEILGNILSLLPTKYAVATSVLSLKWRNHYKLARNLDFDDSLSINHQFRLSIPKRITLFTEFVNGVLIQCINSPITRFRLKCGEYYRADLFTAWQSAALAFRNLTEFDLSFASDVPLEMQLPELACHNLKRLKLVCFLNLRVPELVTFPCLKVLFFQYITFQEDVLNEILSGCQLLEEFVMISCAWKGTCLCFSNPLLKRLTIDVCSGGLPEQQRDCSIEFNLPSLVYLKYYELLPDMFVITNLNSVVHVHLEADFYDDFYEEESAKQKLCNTMLDLINGVSNCEILYLSGRCWEALAVGVFELPVFGKLTRLKLCQGYNAGWNDVLLDLLKNSPCLESLTLVQTEPVSHKELYTDEDEQEKEFLLGGQPVPSCVSSCLKVVKVKNFAGLKGETDMVKYFLEMGNALKDMVIKCRQRNRVREEEISIFKASKSCSLSFKDTN